MIFGKIIPAIPCACGCGILIASYYKKPSIKRKYHRRCFVAWGKHAMPRGENNPNWKRGSYVNASGYKMIKNYDHQRRDKNNYIQEHILIMEKYLGRSIDYDREECHHINGNKLDNRPENIQLMTKGQHSRLSRFEDFKKYGVGNSLRRIHNR